MSTVTFRRITVMDRIKNRFSRATALFACRHCRRPIGVPCWTGRPHERETLRLVEVVCFAIWRVRLGAIARRERCGNYVRHCGALAWLPMFLDDLSPADAWSEEKSCWDEE